MDMCDPESIGSDTVCMFIVYSGGGGGGGTVILFFFFFSLFSRPQAGVTPCKVVFFGLATNALNVRNNNNNNIVEYVSTG